LNYTSYFGNFRNVKNPIAICGKSPDFYKGPEYKKLVPKYSFFKDWKDGIIDNDGYTTLYNEMLETLDVHSVYKVLCGFYKDESFTLLCYEKSGDFCHRHLVADWLNKNGYEIKELQK